MEHIRQYLLTVIAAAILCGVVTNLMGKNGALSAIVKLLAGLFLAVTVISPWAKLQIGDFSAYTGSLSAQANDAAQSGRASANEAVSSIIKSRVEAYILDKAALLGLDISASVEVSGSDPPRPDAVTISGAVSPYARQQLQQIITKDLGIPEDRQSWI